MKTRLGFTDIVGQRGSSWIMALTKTMRSPTSTSVTSKKTIPPTLTATTRWTPKSSMPTPTPSMSFKRWRLGSSCGLHRIGRRAPTRPRNDDNGPVQPDIPLRLPQGVPVDGACHPWGATSTAMAAASNISPRN